VDQKITYLIVYQEKGTDTWNVEAYPDEQTARDMLAVISSFGNPAAGVIFRHRPETPSGDIVLFPSNERGNA
jgi:hypothetical protein